MLSKFVMGIHVDWPFLSNLGSEQSGPLFEDSASTAVAWRHWSGLVWSVKAVAEALGRMIPLPERQPKILWRSMKRRANSFNFADFCREIQRSHILGSQKSSWGSREQLICVSFPRSGNDCSAHEVQAYCQSTASKRYPQRHQSIAATKGLDPLSWLCTECRS